MAVPQLHGRFARGGFAASERLAGLPGAPFDGGAGISRTDLDYRRRVAGSETAGATRIAGCAGRKRGLCAVLGFQAITQLRALYGREQTATMAAAPATKLILRTGEPDTARWSSAQIGEREVSRTQVGASAGPREVRDSFTIHPQRLVESAALPQRDSDVAAVPGLSLHHRAHRRAIVEFSYLAPIMRQAGFVQRLITEPIDRSDTHHLRLIAREIPGATGTAAARSALHKWKRPMA